MIIATLVTLATLQAVASSPPHRAVAPDTTLLTGASRGQAVLRAAIDSSGGQRALTALRAIDFWLDGDSYNPLQGFSASGVDKPARDGRFRSRTAADLTGGRTYQEQLQDLPGGFDFRFATIVTPSRQFNVGFRDRTVSSQAITAGAPGAPLLDGAARYFPALLLRRAAQTLNSARWVGTASEDGRLLDVIDYSWDERTRHRLEIDRETRAVRQLRILTADPVGGLIEATYSYRAHRRLGVLSVADSVRLTRRGFVALDLQVRDVRIDAQVDSTLFTPPAGLNEVPFAGTPVTSQPAPGLYQIAGLGGGAYRSFFIPVEDGVVLFDALLGAPVSNLILGEVRKVVGERPLKAVVVSHFHADHAGGIGALFGTGATVYAPRGSESAIARYAAASGGGDATAIAARIVPVDTGASVTLDHRRGLKVTNLGRVPHVDGVLVLVDSASQTIVNADMYSPLSLFNETFAWFVDWAARLPRPPRNIVGTHHDPMPFDTLRALRQAYGTRGAAR